MALKFLEAPDAKEGLSDDQHRPSFTQTLQDVSDGAVEWVGFFSVHGYFLD